MDEHEDIDHPFEFAPGEEPLEFIFDVGATTTTAGPKLKWLGGELFIVEES